MFVDIFVKSENNWNPFGANLEIGGWVKCVPSINSKKLIYALNIVVLDEITNNLENPRTKSCT